jgi:plasmid stabilization system protein ParE
MNLRVLKHRAAMRDLAEHFDYIALDSEAAALRFYAAAEASFRDLAQNSTMGPACEFRSPKRKRPPPLAYQRLRKLLDLLSAIP